ncbi:unnamed protein product [Umbelopsis vinacea]
MSKHVVVIGAGVIGLTTALLLQKKGYQVTIVAKYAPGDMNIEYTSPYSGAHWRTMIPNDNVKLQGYTNNIGIQLHVVKDFRFAEAHELFPGTVIGHSYTTVAINTPQYLQWLLGLFVQAGGTLEKASLTHIHDALQYCPGALAIVNCTGLQARFLGGVKDEKVFPTRGQVVLVNAPHIKITMTSMTADETTYIIPRSNGHVVLGGTRQANDFNGNIDERTAQGILERTVRLLPELSHGKGVQGLDIVRHNVGLRPTREGGPRMENETRTTADGRTLLITHCYGHGGFGVQSSWGAAKKAVDLVSTGLSGTEHDVIGSIVSDLWSKI